MSSIARFVVLAALAVPATAAAQSPSPTLPSDTLEANFAPRSGPGPAPELAPSLPSDTLDAGKRDAAPDSSSGEMRRDWDQDENGDPWKEDEQQAAARGV
ncbi:MAG TPA: hypothetical protein VEB59_03280 [Gemmatimonadales bacterium]|nr:hypothetical protein [Gemmatimonadales bacterium]